MPTYYYELNGGRIQTTAKFSGGEVYVVPSGGGGGGTMQSKSVSYTPSETAISTTVSPDYGYDGLSSVSVSVGAISSSYVGSDISRRDSTDLSVSGGTVTVPAGYYASNASATIRPASTPTIDSRSVDSSGYVSVDIEIDDGGYIAAGTYQATDSVPLSTQGAQTITPGTTNQTIASGKYLTGTQTILGDADLVASNIKKDVSIFGVTGTYEGGGGGSGMALSDFIARTLRNEDRAVVLTGNTADFLKGMFFRWTNITSFKSLSSSASIGNATYCFADCTDLKTIVLPNITAQTMSSSSMYFAQKSTALEAVDVSFGFYNYSFDGCSSLDTVVLRRSGVTTLGNINAFNGTPFASGGTGGTLYVPNDLLASYQSASNWSTILGYANNQIKSIESTHTDPTAPIDLTLYYADGTAI